MTINYGYRNAGPVASQAGGDQSVTGDTLYIPFSTYNDSGDSEALSGLAVTDVRIFKNGDTGFRATDSGVSLISDTGQYSDRVGLYRFGITIYNTTDDTGFYEAGAQYHVAIDAVTIDGKTVRFFPAVFETSVAGGYPANVVSAAGDTGVIHTGRFASTDTGTRDAVLGKLDTGTSAEITSILSKLDTGTAAEIVAVLSKLDTGVPASIDQTDTGLRDVILTKLDTGVPLSVWQSATRTLSSFGFDTGVTDTVWKASTSAYTDTGSAGYKLDLIDTGIRSAIADNATAINNLSNKVDTGVSIQDTGLYAYLARLDTGITSAITKKLDTGMFDSGAAAAVLDTGKVAASVWVNHGARSVLDTGIAHAVWKSNNSDFTDTGSQGYGVNVHKIRGDTGAAHELQTEFADTGMIDANIWKIRGNASYGTDLANFMGKLSDSGTLDTGTFGGGQLDTGMANNVERILTKLDTGVTDPILTAISNVDTGMRAAISYIDTGITVTAILDDTGLLNFAVWQGSGTRTLTGWELDTGLRQRVDRLDTGVHSDLHRIVAKLDTGIPDQSLTPILNKLDSGVPASINTPLRAKLDTGVPLSVWSQGDRRLTAFSFPVDTGPTQAIQRADTGLQSGITRMLAKIDTGVAVDLTPVTNKLDTGPIPANITQVNSTAVTGTGDTGTNDPWRPA